MAQQTAVEWLENELKKIPFIKPQDAFEQARAMEKEQIKDAYLTGQYDLADKKFGPEQYYNETYRNNDELNISDVKRSFTLDDLKNAFAAGQEQAIAESWLYDDAHPRVEEKAFMTFESWLEQYYKQTYGGQENNTNTGAVGYKALEHKEPVVVGTLRGPNGNTAIFKGDAAISTEEINPFKKGNK